MSIKNRKLKKGEITTALKIALKYVLVYKKQVFWISFFGVLSAIGNGFIPYIMGNFFDSILGENVFFIGTLFKMNSWLFFVILFGITQIGIDFSSFLGGRIYTKIGAKLWVSYKHNVQKRLLLLPKKFFVNTNVGKILEKSSRAGDGVYSIGYDTAYFAPQFLSIIFGFAISFWISWILGIILSIGLVFYLLIIFNRIPIIVDLSKKMQSIWVKSSGYEHSALSNIGIVKNSVTEKYESNKLGKIFKVLIKTDIQNGHAWDNTKFLENIVITITRITIFAVSVFLIQNKTITIGELIALNGYAMMLFGPFVAIGHQWNRIQKNLIAINDSEKTFEMLPENYEPKNVVKLDNLKGDIEFKNVFFHYNKKDGTVLKDINLKIKQGEKIALVGESGVGKSTLIELIQAYYFAQKGQILIDGVNIKRLSLGFLRKNIAIVPQEISLFNETIKNNIKYGKFDASDEEIGNVAKEAYADLFINKFKKKYSQEVGERGVKLSVGQKQRIAIARAMLQDPKILILDEPTSALDLEVERMVTESMDKLMEGRTTLIIAHRLSTVRKADRIIVFKEGRIVEVGTHDKLIKIEGGVYKHLSELNIGLE